MVLIMTGCFNPEIKLILMQLRLLNRLAAAIQFS